MSVKRVTQLCVQVLNECVVHDLSYCSPALTFYAKTAETTQ